MTDKLRVLVADDELMARRRLIRLLAEMDDVELAGECDGGAAVLARVTERDVDVVLLDIRMPGLDGIETLRLLPEDAPYVVFCTAHRDHAVDAFDAGAIDYLLKPIEGPRLAKALGRARQRDVRQRFQSEVVRQKALGLRRIAVPTKSGVVLLDPAQISHAVLEGELVSIATAQGTFLSDASLSELETKLPPSFMRVHRKALLNLDQVAKLEPNDVGGFIARTARGESIVVSRKSARELRRMLGLRKGPDDER
jgi:two-component system, LytTR family, response regulator